MSGQRPVFSLFYVAYLFLSLATAAQAQVRVQQQDVPTYGNTPGTGGNTGTGTPTLQTPGTNVPGIQVPGAGLPPQGTVAGKKKRGGKKQTDLSPPTHLGGNIDYMEQMRLFVQNVSAFAHQHNKDFMVVVQNGLELLTKNQFSNVENPQPARAYMRAIDGVLLEGLYFGATAFGKEPVRDEIKAQKELLTLAEIAKKGGLKVLVMDYAKKRSSVSKSFWRSAREGFVSFVADARGLELNHLPPYAKWPFNENSDSILSIQNVENYVVVRDSSPFGLQEQFVREIRETNFDMVVVDVFHGPAPLTKENVRALKYKKLGAKRLVLAYLDIGRAASYRHYWQDDWGVGNPPYITARYPGNPDKYFVEYWWPQWQRIISGDTNSYIYGIIDLGFDGVILDGVNAYQHFVIRKGIF